MIYSKGINRCIAPISECRVEENDIPLFKKYLFLFPQNIKNDILIHKEYYGLENIMNRYKDEVGMVQYDPSNLDIRLEWVKSPFLNRPGDKRNPLYETNFIWDFYDMIKNFNVWDIKLLRRLYESICRFIRKYIEYIKRKEDVDIIDKLCHFLLMDVFYSCVKATKLIYKYAQSTEEFEITNSFFRHIDTLVDLCMHRTYSKNEIDTFSYFICTFYKLYDLNFDSLSLNSSDTFDPFLLYYLNFPTAYQLQKINVGVTISNYVNNFNLGNIKDINMVEYAFTENTSDVNVYYDDITGISDTNVTIFGNTPYVTTLTDDIDKLKQSLFKINSDLIRSYLNKGDETKINFVIDEQLKMYLQSELDCKMIVANVRRSDESNMMTILQYENDNFVLFTVSDDSGTLYGLTLDEDAYTQERKLISIDKDDDLTFRFVINIDEE